MAEQLLDTFGRVHRDLRISVTDRCNFRCTYCMPPEGLDWLPRSELLTFEEIERVARMLVERFGVHSIRLTGGEPTVRARLAGLVGMLAPLGTDLALTTNGVTLSLLADDLAAAGLRRINISLDSLQADRFRDVTLRDDLHRVLDGVDAALAAGLDPVKINVVVMRDVNDDELLDFAAFGRDKASRCGSSSTCPSTRRRGGRKEAVVSLTEITQRIGECSRSRPPAGERTGEPFSAISTARGTSGWSPA